MASELKRLTTALFFVANNLSFLATVLNKGEDFMGCLLLLHPGISEPFRLTLSFLNAALPLNSKASLISSIVELGFHVWREAGGYGASALCFVGASRVLLNPVLLLLVVPADLHFFVLDALRLFCMVSNQSNDRGKKSRRCMLDQSFCRGRCTVLDLAGALCSGLLWRLRVLVLKWAQS